MAKKIMIIDDSESVRKVLESVLLEAGFEIFEGIDGKDALEKLSDLKPVRKFKFYSDIIPSENSYILWSIDRTITCRTQ